MLERLGETQARRRRIVEVKANFKSRTLRKEAKAGYESKSFTEEEELKSEEGEETERSSSGHSSQQILPLKRRHIGDEEHFVGRSEGCIPIGVRGKMKMSSRKS